MSTGSLLAATLAAGLVAGGRQVYPVAEAPAALRPAIQRGDLVIVSLQSAVLRELNAAIAHGGPEHALQSCHVEAAALALAISRREGIEAGRTSAHLRNVRNAPRPWAADIVARYDGRTAPGWMALRSISATVSGCSGRSSSSRSAPRVTGRPTSWRRQYEPPSPRGIRRIGR
ncbi:MAG TPA: hypothetical protein VFK57_24955 [Vicinamibacterales bacterium]|nr:hypothetical protein [Vicinamibacterales bacterium]